MLRLLLVSLMACSCVYGYKSYQNKIPNGGSIPHPCKPNYIWQGVGHENVLGGGVRNPFGTAFKAAGATWTVDLCAADSDGDGRTNGEELGDPDCSWTSGSGGLLPQNSVNISHPGVCEPTDSADCLNKNGWTIDCSEGADFTCPGIDEPDTIEVEMKFDRTHVPVGETTYMCQTFDVPSDKEYHMFATKPLINNAYVMHHTLLYGCPAEVDIDQYRTPQVCGMNTGECDIIGVWTLGSNGECQNENHGILVGKGHFTRILMEHHWNNPSNEVNYYDESGMSIFITPNIREQSLNIFITGQSHLELPPGRQSWTVVGECTETCSREKLAQQPVYITSAYLHMHYLGQKGSIKQWRDGNLINTWANEETYSYDTPVFHQFDPPIEFRAGDRIETTCGFNTMSRKEITYTGLATNDEMCFGLMNYYPKEADIGMCISYKDMDACEVADWRDDLKDKTNSAMKISAAQLFTLTIAFILSMF